MTPAQKRAKALANEIKKAMKQARAAEARAKELGEELMTVLAQAKAEAEVERTVVEYPSGLYQCASCGHSVIFTEPTNALPACDNCGSRKYTGQEPKITHIKPPPPKRYPAGMYECAACHARIALPEAADSLSACDFCGAGKLKAVQV